VIEGWGFFLFIPLERNPLLRYEESLLGEILKVLRKFVFLVSDPDWIACSRSSDPFSCEGLTQGLHPASRDQAFVFIRLDEQASRKLQMQSGKSSKHGLIEK
jgi:hypothetical protein